MAPGDFLVLSEDMSAFSARFPVVANVLGNLGFSLGNGGDTVRLFNTRKELVDEVTFDDVAPWPTQPDGRGPTLELGRPGSDNSAPSNWRASELTSGSPGAPNGPVLSQALAPDLAAGLNGGDLSLRFHAQPARSYLIQTSTDLNQWADWRLLIGDGAERTITIGPRDPEVGRFYRVSVRR
jgi:hypothetical protein